MSHCWDNEVSSWIRQCLRCLPALTCHELVMEGGTLCVCLQMGPAWGMSWHFRGCCPHLNVTDMACPYNGSHYLLSCVKTTQNLNHLNQESESCWMAWETGIVILFLCWGTSPSKPFTFQTPCRRELRLNGFWAKKEVQLYVKSWLLPPLLFSEELALPPPLASIVS